jgi:hypothetical protein
LTIQEIQEPLSKEREVISHDKKYWN